MTPEFWIVFFIAVMLLVWWATEVNQRLEVEMDLLRVETRLRWAEGQLVLTRTAIYRLDGKYPYLIDEGPLRRVR